MTEILAVPFQLGELEQQGSRCRRRRGKEDLGYRTRRHLLLDHLANFCHAFQSGCGPVHVLLRRSARNVRVPTVSRRRRPRPQAMGRRDADREPGNSSSGEGFPGTPHLVGQPGGPGSVGGES